MAIAEVILLLDEVRFQRIACFQSMNEHSFCSRVEYTIIAGRDKV